MISNFYQLTPFPSELLMWRPVREPGLLMEKQTTERNRMRSFTRFIHYAIGRGALLLTVAFICVAQAASTPFTHVYTKGDSLSDAGGRLYQLSGGVLPPSPPYCDGRFSNGKVWVEYLVEGLGMDFVAADCYATGGAMTGSDNYKDGVANQTYPGLQDEVTSYSLEHSVADANGALFIVWAGANDFFYALENRVPPNQLIQQGVVNTLTAVQRLWMAGAREIMVVDIPDLGITPFGRSTGAGSSITSLVMAYNQVLAQGLDALEQAGIKTIRFSSFAVLREIVNDPAKFGFANVTDQLLGVSANPDTYLFWDQVHPTTRGHQLLADAAIDTLVRYYSPAQSEGNSQGRVHALHGLVHASPAAAGH
jgi:phospholipase/lecithinase/hemolysin